MNRQLLTDASFVELRSLQAVVLARIMRAIAPLLANAIIRVGGDGQATPKKRKTHAGAESGEWAGLAASVEEYLNTSKVWWRFVAVVMGGRAIFSAPISIFRVTTLALVALAGLVTVQV